MLQTVTRAEARRLFGGPDPKTATGLRNRIVLRLFYSCGLRVREAIGARLEDADPAARLLTVGEGGQRRAIGMIDALATDLRRWLTLHHPGGPWLVCSVTSGHEGGQVSASYLRQMVSREAAAVGIDPDRVSASILRDTFGRELVQEGWHFDEVAAVMGLVDPRGALRFAGQHEDLPARLRARVDQAALIGGPEEASAAGIIGELIAATGGRRDLAKAIIDELRPELIDELTEAAG
jgi:integrase